MTMSSKEPAPGCKVFVGDLKPDTQEREVEEAFAKFGQLRNCFVARAPGGFGFVEFEDPRDAEEAVRKLDGTLINGAAIRTEISHGRRNTGKKMTWPPGRSKYYGERSGRGYSPEPRRSRGYSPPRRGGGMPVDPDQRRLQQENENLRAELQALKAAIAAGKY